MDPLRHQLDNFKLKVDTIEDGLLENVEEMTDRENPKDSQEASIRLDLNSPDPMDI